MIDQVQNKSETVMPEVGDSAQTPEVSPISEQIPASPVQPLQQDDDVQATWPDTTLEPVASSDVTEQEVVDLASPDVEPADNNWVGKVREVIQKDKDQPYNEEVDAEDLNQAYMKQRFGVNIDKESK